MKTKTKKTAAAAEAYIGFRLPFPDKAKLQRVADKNDRSVSAQVRATMRREIEIAGKTEPQE